MQSSQTPARRSIALRFRPSPKNLYLGLQREDLGIAAAADRLDMISITILHELQMSNYLQHAAMDHKLVHHHRNDLSIR
jgi:hypothetical protein